MDPLIPAVLLDSEGKPTTIEGGPGSNLVPSKSSLAVQGEFYFRVVKWEEEEALPLPRGSVVYMKGSLSERAAHQLLQEITIRKLVPFEERNQDLLVHYLGEHSEDQMSRLLFASPISPACSLHCIVENLRSRREPERALIPTEIQAIAYDVIKGIRYMHQEKKIVLCLLTCGDIHYHGNRFKISGFTYAVEQFKVSDHHHVQLRRGVTEHTRPYLAPEVELMNSSLALVPLMDIYSFGVLLWELMVAHPLRILSPDPLQLLPHTSTSLSTSQSSTSRVWPPLLVDILKGCLQGAKTKSRRLRVKEIEEKLSANICPLGDDHVLHHEAERLNESISSSASWISDFSTPLPYASFPAHLKAFQVHVVDIDTTAQFGVLLLEEKHPLNVTFLPQEEKLRKVFIKSAALGRNPKFAEQEKEIAAKLAGKNIPNVVQTLGFHLDIATHKVLIVYERADMGDLYRYLHGKPNNFFDFATKLGWMRGIATGLDHLHKLDISHRDIKSPNILMFSLDGFVVPKLGDFDFSTEGEIDQDTTRTRLGTWRWAAPEILFPGRDRVGLPRCRYIPTQVDLYSLGCVMWELLFEAFPYSETHPSPTLGPPAHDPGPLLNTKSPEALEILCEPFPPLVLLVKKCLDSNPEARASTKEILEVLSSYLTRK